MAEAEQARDLAPLEFTHNPDRDVRVTSESRATRVWRYVDLAKLIALLMDRALYLARADSFDDKWEGSFGALDAAERLAAGPRRSKKLDHRTYRYDVISTLLPTNTFINCWHINDGESDAMWSIYSSRTHGVAVQSTIERLSSALRLPTPMQSHPDLLKPVFIAPVEYADYTHLATHFDDEKPFLYKRKSFEHEREVRIITQTIVQGEGRNLPHVKLAVDLDELIERVYVSPYAQGWFKGVVEAVVRRFDLGCPIEYSDLRADPIR
jgi:hypothetical protein